MPRILVVDDDPDVVTICSLVFESEGYDVSTARNGREAYNFLSHNETDAVLLDVMMPFLDGISVCKMVKRDPHTKDLPIVIMSASERLYEGRACSANAVIPKPFDIDHLVDTINELVALG